WNSTEWFVNAGNGFHSNDARGVIYRYDAASGAAVGPAPALAAAYGREIGVRSEIVPGLQTSLALWRLDSASELVYSADSGGTEINGASRRHGVEWNNHYALDDWLLLDADFAWTHARYADANANGAVGDFIPNAVGKVAALGLSVHDLSDWSGDVKLRYIGPYPLTQDGSLHAPSATVVNLRAQRALGAHATLALDLLNLFDRAYYDIAYAQDYRATPTGPVVSSGTTVH